MERDEAITGFSALATPSRVEVLRYLANQSPDGVPSGEIAKALDVATNTLSTQLLLLSNARLVRSRRDGRQIIYSLNLETIRELLEFIADECAGKRLGLSIKEQGA